MKNLIHDRCWLSLQFSPVGHGFVLFHYFNIQTLYLTNLAAYDNCGVEVSWCYAVTLVSEPACQCLRFRMSILTSPKVLKQSTPVSSQPLMWVCICLPTTFYRPANSLLSSFFFHNSINILPRICCFRFYTLSLSQPFQEPLGLTVTSKKGLNSRLTGSIDTPDTPIMHIYLDVGASDGPVTPHPHPYSRSLVACSRVFPGHAHQWGCQHHRRSYFHYHVRRMLPFSCYYGIPYQLL